MLLQPEVAKRPPGSHSQTLKFFIDLHPMTYLKVSILSIYLRQQDQEIFIEKVRDELLSWKIKYLSQVWQIDISQLYPFLITNTLDADLSTSMLSDQSYQPHHEEFPLVQYCHAPSRGSHTWHTTRTTQGRLNTCLSPRLP